MCELVCSLYSVRCVCSYTPLSGRMAELVGKQDTLLLGYGGGQERLIHAAIVAGMVRHSGLWRTLFTRTLLT